MYSYEEFDKLYPNININSIKQVVKSWHRKINLNGPLTKPPLPLVQSSIYTQLKCKKSKQFYEILNQNNTEATCRETCNETFDLIGKNGFWCYLSKSQNVKLLCYSKDSISIIYLKSVEKSIFSIMINIAWI